MHAKYLKLQAIMGNNIKKTWLLYGLWLIGLCACQNERVKVLYAKPKALGAICEVGIVAHDSIWEGRQGKNLRAFLAKNAPFTCLHIQPEDTVYFVGWHRNLVYLNLSKQEKNILDERAFGQTSQYITRSPADTNRWENITAYIWKQEKQRLRDYKYSFEASQSTVLEDWIAKRYPFRLRLPPELQVWKRSPEMLWLKADRGEERHLYISKTAKKNILFLPTEFAGKDYITHTVWKKGYQATFFAPRLLDKEKMQLLEMEAILETWDFK